MRLPGFLFWVFGLCSGAAVVGSAAGLKGLGILEIFKPETVEWADAGPIVREKLAGLRLR